MEVSDREIDELYGLAYSVALRLLDDPYEAKDCAQESTARALDRWSKVAPYASAWVVRVSSNLAIGVLRKRRRTIVGLPEDGRLMADVLDGVATRVDVRAGLLALSSRQRQVLVLRYIGDLSEEDTAQVMSVSLTTVKTHAQRGLERLRRLLVSGPT